MCNLEDNQSAAITHYEHMLREALHCSPVLFFPRVPLSKSLCKHFSYIAPPSMMSQLALVKSFDSTPLTSSTQHCLFQRKTGEKSEMIGGVPHGHITCVLVIMSIANQSRGIIINFAQSNRSST